LPWHFLIGFSVVYAFLTFDFPVLKSKLHVGGIGLQKMWHDGLPLQLQVLSPLFTHHVSVILAAFC
jgi:hypothetical protein